MKLLKFKVPSGYKMLEKGFEVNLLTKTRVDKDKEHADLFELEPGFYYPVETIFIGKNSSGKTTVLTLIQLIMFFIKSGRVPAFLSADQNELDLELMFYDEGYIYRYEGHFDKPQLNASSFMTIKSESLRRTTYKESYRKDLSNISFRKENLIPAINGSDTSNIARFYFDATSIFIDMVSSDTSNFSWAIERVNRDYGDGAFNSLVRLFDDSVESLDVIRLDDHSSAFKFKRVNQVEMTVNLSYLKERLSSGTYRGIYLFAFALLAFRHGGMILIDEIEKSFNKNLIENLMNLFTDRRINKMQASLVYSTHYSEILDHSDRSDNINVLHREGDHISSLNLSTDYNIRTDISKSNQFDQNAFDNLVNYDCLMDLRRYLLG